MDFDDLDDLETAAGAAPDQRREELAREAMPPKKSFPFPSGRNFGSGGKMKILFLYGGGVNQRVGKMQLMSIFKETSLFKNMEFDILEAPRETDLSWHPENQQAQLRPFGNTIYLYFDRMPHANSQWESWEGIEESWDALKEQFAKHGPYDGVCGFDMGGEVLVHAARMAQEDGDPAFARMFRFMILFTTASSRHLSRLGKAGKRPKAPLQIPTICSWSNKDENHPYTWYEETALFIAPECREVIHHHQGHLPAKFSRNTEETDRFVTFLEAMYNGTPWKPSEHPDNAWNRELWLPIKRAEPQHTPTSASRRRLLVVTDPMGGHDYDKRVKQMQASLAAFTYPAQREPIPFKVTGVPDMLGNEKMNLEVSMLTVDKFKAEGGDDIIVEGVEFTAELKGYNWHCTDEEVLGAMMKKQDIIPTEQQDMMARKWADDFLQTFSLDPDDSLAVVGLGTGSFLAYAFVRALIRERRVVPAGLWLIDPPTRLPFETTLNPGVLVDCPVRYFTHSTSVVGAPWRYETATFGPFSVATFKDTDEVVGKVVDEFRAM